MKSNYQILVLDLDGTLTNSKKEITEATRKGLIELQRSGKILVLASGRPINGVAPLAARLDMDQYNGYMLSFNGARITKCATGEIIYNKTVPHSLIRPVWEYIRTIPGLDIISYSDTDIISGIASNRYVEHESKNSHMKIVHAPDFPSALDFPVNKLLISGEPDIIEKIMEPVRARYPEHLNIFRSEPFYLELMPPGVDKADSLRVLSDSLGLTSDDMICCGDGYNDISMIRYAGLGVAMENAQPDVRAAADFITRSNDEDGVLHVVELFMR